MGVAAAYLSISPGSKRYFQNRICYRVWTVRCYRNDGLQLRKDKCKFALSELECMGHIVSKEGHKPVPGRVCNPGPYFPIPGFI